MRWFLPILCAAVGGWIGGWPVALLGFTLGYVIAALLPKRRRGDSPQEQPQPVQEFRQKIGPPPLPPAEPSIVDRLHAHMRELDIAQRAPEFQSRPPPLPISHIGASISFGREEGVPARQRKTPPKLTWYAPGETFIHAGLVIDSGMIYTSDRPLPWPGEPSAITASVSVAAVAAHPLADFGYYPSYDRVSAEHRRCYLEWLSAGRRDDDPTQRSLGYVFLFFYGLERRIILDLDRDPALLEEIFRLLQHYGSAHKSRSLRSYCLQLLHFAGWQQGIKAYRQLWPRLLELDVNRPDEDGLRVVLANLYQRGEPLDWTVGFRLAMANQESRRSTVVIATQEKFFALFEQRYKDRFPTGLMLEAAKQEALIQYRAASSALMQMSYERQGDNSLNLRIPNVMGLHRQFQALPQIWNSCVDDLSGYSRAVKSKKQGQGAAIAAWKSLPPELRKLEDHPLKTAFADALASAPREGDYSFLSTSVLATLADVEERAKLTSSHSRQIAEIINQLGWHLAPDPRITGLPLSWNQELALYTATEQARSERLAGPLRLLYLAVTLAAADGVIEPEELNSFYQLVAPQVSHENDWRPIRATEAALRRDANVALRSLPQMSKDIPMESRQFVLRLMAHIAAADGEVTLDELKVLRRMARAFQLNVDSVERLLRDDEAFREVTVAAGDHSRARGEAIPVRPAEKTVFALDQDRIKALTHETQEVISMLSVVMADPEEPPCAPPQVVPQVNSAPVEWLNGLPARYHTAVLALIRHDEIITKDFDCMAADHYLMPDDLFNAVNTWADETLGDFLLERGENIRIFRSLLPDVAAVSIAA
jgi:tellurite resistance protein